MSAASPADLIPIPTRAEAVILVLNTAVWMGGAALRPPHALRVTYAARLFISGPATPPLTKVIAWSYERTADAAAVQWSTLTQPDRAWGLYTQAWGDQRFALGYIDWPAAAPVRPPLLTRTRAVGSVG